MIGLDEDALFIFEFELLFKEEIVNNYYHKFRNFGFLNTPLVNSPATSEGVPVLKTRLQRVCGLLRGPIERCEQSTGPQTQIVVFMKNKHLSVSYIRFCRFPTSKSFRKGLVTTSEQVLLFYDFFQSGLKVA